MNQQLAEENKQKLLAEQKRLKTILNHEAKFEGKGDFPGDYQPKFEEVGREEGENASEVEQYATDLAVTQDLEQDLNMVETALKRIEDGTYGKCLQGDEIEEDRLRALPSAATCIKHSK